MGSIRSRFARPSGFRFTLLGVLGTALVQIPFVCTQQASAIDLPPGSATGGSTGVPIAPPTVYLTRSTFYVGEVIAGQLDCPSCYASPTFRNELGTVVAGSLIFSDSNPGAFVFVPETPLAPGTYTAEIENFNPTYFTVIEGEAEQPTFLASFHEVKVGIGTPVTCQSYASGHWAESYPQSRVDAGLGIALSGESTDQYQFEYAVNEGMRDAIGTSWPVARFAQGHGEVCVEVFALPYVDDSEISLGVSCLNPDDALELGVRDEPFGLVENVLRVCVLPPDGYLDEWCDLHAEAFERHSCLGFVDAACTQARYECPLGDLPEWNDDSGTDPDTDEPTDEMDSGDERNSSDPGGCSCKAGAGSLGSRNATWMFAGLGVALLALRRRHRKLVE